MSPAVSKFVNLADKNVTGRRPAVPGFFYRNIAAGRMRFTLGLPGAGRTQKRRPGLHTPCRVHPEKLQHGTLIA